MVVVVVVLVEGVLVRREKFLDRLFSSLYLLSGSDAIGEGPSLLHVCE